MRVAFLNLCWHRSIFPGSRPPSIFDTDELNFCVRNGNRWILIAISTNYLLAGLQTSFRRLPVGTLFQRFCTLKIEQ